MCCFDAIRELGQGLVHVNESRMRCKGIISVDSRPIRDCFEAHTSSDRSTVRSSHAVIQIVVGCRMLVYSQIVNWVKW